MTLRTSFFVGAAAACLTVTAVPLSATAAPAHPAATRSCGVIHYRFERGAETGTVKTSHHTCATARKVLKTATKHSFDFGDTLPVGRHFRCQASQRPEVGYHPKLIVACHATGETATAFGITST